MNLLNYYYIFIKLIIVNADFYQISLAKKTMYPTPTQNKLLVIIMSEFNGI